MTNIRIYRNGQGRLCGFSVIGHTGSAPAGEDIVCAGVSALAQTAANALETVAGIRPILHMGDGFMSVRLPRELDPGKLFVARIILKTVQQGFTDIVASYPQYVRISR